MQPGNYQPIAGSYVVPSAPPSYEEALYSHQPYPPQPYPPPPQPYPPPLQPYPPQAGTDPKFLNSVPYIAQPPPMQPPVAVQTVYVQQPTVFHDYPVQMCCPYCGQIMATRINHTSGALTWLSCGGLCLLGCGAGCCLIPFCIDSLKDVHHYCSSCNAHVGSYKRI